MSFIKTTSLPNPGAKRDDQCGAFYNLYRVIGDCTHGVPASDTDSPYERAEMFIARIRMNAMREKYEFVSIQEMIATANSIKVSIGDVVYRFE